MRFTNIEVIYGSTNEKTDCPREVWIGQGPEETFCDGENVGLAVVIRIEPYAKTHWVLCVRSRHGTACSFYHSIKGTWKLGRSGVCHMARDFMTLIGVSRLILSLASSSATPCCTCQAAGGGSSI